MNNLVVIVEGETEQTFVQQQLAAHLALRGVNVWPVLPGKHRQHGGTRKWEVAKQDIIRTLKERRYCSTMFDFYAMPKDWPGRTVAAKQPAGQRAAHVEQAVHAEIVGAMGDRFDPKFFIPYVQLHEFEALAFSDVDILATTLAPIGKNSAENLAEQFGQIVMDAGTPEAINDSYETCPSRRITGIVPAYKKRAQGPIITGRIGLNALRARCPHFGNWLTRLEAISPDQARA